MDREKAADLLDNLIGMVEDNHGADYDTALKMGIEALSTSGDGPEPVDDTISRQAAIDALMVAIDDVGILDGDDIKVVFDNLPSAQPEQQWIPCSDKLPEEYGEYRITWTTSASKSRFIGDSEYEITGEWDSENYRFKGEWLLPDYIKAYPSVKVLAWHELEEPWRGEETCTKNAK